MRTIAAALKIVSISVSGCATRSKGLKLIYVSQFNTSHMIVAKWVLNQLASTTSAEVAGQQDKTAAEMHGQLA